MSVPWETIQFIRAVWSYNHPLGSLSTAGGGHFARHFARPLRYSPRSGFEPVFPKTPFSANGLSAWTPALDRHRAIFGRAPDLAAGDRGFSSAKNEQAAVDRGVRRVILPRSGPKSPARRP